MPLMVGSSGNARNLSKIVGRGLQSGGSVGGDKKTGTVQYGSTWARGNQGNYLARAQCCRQFSIAYILAHSNYHPTQISGYRATHSGMLG
jgi:hypothetical protein